MVERRNRIREDRIDMGTDVVEQRAKKTRQISDEDKALRQAALRAFSVSYETDADNGVTQMRIRGDVTISVVERIGEDGSPVFTSPFVAQPQTDFLQALEYTGRNLMTNAVKSEYIRQNPGSVSPRGKAAQEAARADAAEARAAALEARIREIEAQLNGAGKSKRGQ